MKALTDQEKIALIRYHGQCLAAAFSCSGGTYKADILEHASRVSDLVKSISKLQFSIEK